MVISPIGDIRIIKFGQFNKTIGYDFPIANTNIKFILKYVKTETKFDSVVLTSLKRSKDNNFEFRIKKLHFKHKYPQCIVNFNDMYGF